MSIHFYNILLKIYRLTLIQLTECRVRPIVGHLKLREYGLVSAVLIIACRIVWQTILLKNANRINHECRSVFMNVVDRGCVINLVAIS